MVVVSSSVSIQIIDVVSFGKLFLEVVHSFVKANSAKRWMGSSQQQSARGLSYRAARHTIYIFECVFSCVLFSIYN